VAHCWVSKTSGWEMGIPLRRAWRFGLGARRGGVPWRFRRDAHDIIDASILYGGFEAVQSGEQRR
jgi:hypothetical protein